MELFFDIETELAELELLDKTLSDGESTNQYRWEI